MNHRVSHGADTEALDDIAVALRRQGELIDDVGGRGSANLEKLRAVWDGPDFEVFAKKWRQAHRQVDEASQAIRLYSKKLVAEAEDQRSSSSSPSRGGGGGAGGVGGGSGGRASFAGGGSGATEGGPGGGAGSGGSATMGAVGGEAQTFVRAEERAEGEASFAKVEGQAGHEAFSRVEGSAGHEIFSRVEGQAAHDAFGQVVAQGYGRLSGSEFGELVQQPAINPGAMLLALAYAVPFLESLGELLGLPFDLPDSTGAPFIGPGIAFPPNLDLGEILGLDTGGERTFTLFEGELPYSDREGQVYRLETAEQLPYSEREGQVYRLDTAAGDPSGATGSPGSQPGPSAPVTAPTVEPMTPGGGAGDNAHAAWNPQEVSRWSGAGIDASSWFDDEFFDIGPRL